MSDPQTTNGNPPSNSKDLQQEMSENVRKCPDLENALSPQQHTAVRLLILGRSDTSIAKLLNVSPRTLYRWKSHHPLFRLELSRRRQGLWHNSADKLRSLLPKALKILNEHLDDPYDKTRFRAALHTLR